VDAREEKDMFALVIKEKDSVEFGVIEVKGEEYTVSFGSDFDAAEDALIEWSDWMERGINNVVLLESKQTGDYVNTRPSNVESIALVFTRGNRGSVA
jgi:hypothetical protein